MFIADSQVHIWAAATPGRPWAPGREPHRAEPLTGEALLREMDAAGVSRAVLIPPSWDCDRNDLVLAAALRYPGRFAAVGRPGADIASQPGLIAGWLSQPGMAGLRLSLTLPPWLEAFADDRLEWLWAAAEAAELPIMALVSHDMAPAMDRVAERHPALKLALCHLALPTGVRDHAAFKDFERLLPLARRPNVAVKVSALPAYTSDAYPYRAVHGYVRQVYDAFGPERMFWGTDLARLPCSYRAAVTMFTEELPWLSDEDKGWIMGRGLCAWLGWPLPGA